MIGFMRQALVILTLAILPVMHPALDLTANASIGLQTSEAAVALAAADLARDLSWVLGSMALL
jgi:hypothetical protein